MSEAIERYVPFVSLVSSAALVLALAHLARQGQERYDPAEHVVVREILPGEQMQAAFDRESLLAATELSDFYVMVQGLLISETEEMIHAACDEAADRIIAYDGYFSRAYTALTRSKEELAEEVVEELQSIHAEHLAPLIDPHITALRVEEATHSEALRAPSVAVPIVHGPVVSIEDVQAQEFFSNLRNLWSFTRKLGEDGFEFVPWFGLAHGLTRAVYDHRTETMIVQPARGYCVDVLSSGMAKLERDLKQAYGDPKTIQARFAADWSTIDALTWKQ